MRKKLWISIGVTFLITIFVGTSVYQARSQDKPDYIEKTVQLEEREFVDNIMVPGTLQFQQEQYYYNEPEKGKLIEVLVKEGELIKEGTPILKYQNEQLTLEKEQNLLSLESNHLQINQIEEQIKSLNQREKDLKKQILETEAELESQKTEEKETPAEDQVINEPLNLSGELTTYKDELSQIEVELSQLKSELKMADIELRQAKLQKETIDDEIEELVVKSKSAGTVLTVNQNTLDNTELSQPILLIGDPKKFVVKGVISEYDSLKIKKEQIVKVKSEVVENEEWNGKVTSVGILPVQNELSTGDQNESVQYPLVVSIDGENIIAKPGFKLIMEIETEKKMVKSIPIDAIQQEEENYYVFVVKNDIIEKREVQVGKTSGEYIEISSGLDQKDSIVANPSNDLENGSEVTVND